MNIAELIDAISFFETRSVLWRSCIQFIVYGIGTGVMCI